MKNFFDEWFSGIALLVILLVILLGLTIGLVIGINNVYTHDLEREIKRYEDYHECVKSGVDYVVCEIHFLE